MNTSITTEPVSVLTPAGITKSIIENVTTPVISTDINSTNDTINAISNDSTVTEYVNPPWIVIFVIALVVALVLGILIILRKRLRHVCDHLFRWAINSICKRHSQFEKEAEDVKEMNIMGSTVTEETKNLLEKEEKTLMNNGINPSKQGKPYISHTEISQICSRNSRQEGIPKNPVVKNLEDASRSKDEEKGRNEKVERLTADDDTSTERDIAGPAYYNEEEFHAIAHGSCYAGNGGNERETFSEISSTSTESSISEEINSEALSQTASSNFGVQVSRQNADRNGVIRVITEIDLR